MLKWVHSLTARFMLFAGIILLVLIGGIYAYEWDKIRADSEKQLFEKGSTMAVSLSKALQSITENDIRDGIILKDGTRLSGEDLKRNLFNDNLQLIPESELEAQKRAKDPAYAALQQKLFDGRMIPLSKYELKYTSAYDAYTDDHWQRVIDGFLTDENVIFVVPIAYSANPDFNGYVGTHNMKSSPLGEESKDAWGTTGINSQKYRANRVFNDIVGYTAASYKDTSQTLLQKYSQVVEQQVFERWDLAYPLVIDGKNWGAVRVDLSKQASDAFITQQRLKVALEFGGLYIGVLLLLFLLSGAIVSRKLRFVLQAATNLNSQEADLTYRIPVRGKDEMAMLAIEINKFIAHLQEMMGTIGRMSNQVGAISGHLTDSAVRSTATASGISHTIESLSHGAGSQAISAEDSAKAMGEMAVGIQRIAEASAEVSEATQHLAREAEDGDRASEQAMRQMVTLSESASGVGLAIDKLEQGMDAVGGMAQVISGIASQTGLLALNAAIEAARAGEQGKGFAVVASEVRKLADQSEASARQINERITDIQASMAAAVHAMSLGEAEIKDGVLQVGQLREVLSRMLNSVNDVSTQMEEISAAAEQMSAGTEEVTAGIEEIARIAGSASDQAQQVAEASLLQLQDSEATSTRSQELMEAAGQLKATADKFKV
ncbi:methyl-accepting chemotaxis protein [Paenibacillus agricola]|uniref:Methyl-accepting chemotaxis protein n=1 Tax=Paenibacillus agricola TaxID=2716264 RepID=A0ABX0J8A3_9BACL|nr:methyl-accepting chemotaxis protein [Paenibacillus agricola]NHN32031.1 methyl-accepting chemotaxis protein [Paenibacillus agricola]